MLLILSMPKAPTFTCAKWLRSLQQAMKGEQWAIRELADRIDGPVAQISLHCQSDEHEPIRYVEVTSGALPYPLF